MRELFTYSSSQLERQHYRVQTTYKVKLHSITVPVSFASPLRPISRLTFIVYDVPPGSAGDNWRVATWLITIFLFVVPFDRIIVSA